MSITAEPNCCPKCGAPILSEAPAGLCPKCLLVQAATPTEAGPRAASKSAPPTQAELARAFPQLEVLELIGQGGMGFVFKARQRKLQRLVALKILPASLAADPAFAERFTREGRLLAQLSHPNIVTIHDFGQADGFFYLLMEFVDGVNLRQAMRIGRLTPAQALAIVPKICEALQFAHNEGILHRDIKPENILLDAKGRVKIADFGIAKLMDSEGRAGSPLHAESPQTEDGAQGVTHPTQLTGTGKILGTPHYMAPEQLEKPQEVDHRADIYSLGVVFYEMLTGELPLGRFAPPSEKSTADPRLDEVVFRALEKDPGRRTQTAGEVKTQVETISGTGQAAGGIPHADSDSETSAARYARHWKRALIAAALTCVSLAIFHFGFLILIGLHVKPVPALLVLLLPLGILALVGMVMGILILAEVRQTSGQWRGFKPAIFATVAWPLWLLDLGFIGVLFGSFQQPLHFYQGPKLGCVLLFFSAIAVLGLDFVVVQSVARWVKRLPLQRISQRIAAGASLWLILFFGSLLWAITTSHQAEYVTQYAEPPVNIPPGYESGEPPLPPGYRSAEPTTDSNPSTQEARLVISAEPYQPANPEPGQVDWGFKLFVPPGHIASVLFVRWSNGVPQIDPGYSAYYKVGNAGGVDVPFCSLACYRIPESQYANLSDVQRRQLLTNWSYPESFGLKSAVRWDINLGLGFTSSSWKAMPPFHKVETSLPQTLRSGHQYVMRLVDFDAPQGDANQGRSGVELRFFLEPLKLPAVRMVPGEKDMGTHVAGTGLAGTMEATLKLLEQFPMESSPDGLGFQSGNGANGFSKGQAPMVQPNDQPAKPAMGKTVVFVGATNQLLNSESNLRVVSVHTDSNLLPGEKITAMSKRLDDQMVAAQTSFFIHRSQGTTGISSYLSWALPGSFGPQDFDSAASQMRNWTERPVMLTPGNRLVLFSLTNTQGGVFTGYAQYERTTPATRAGSDDAGSPPKTVIHLRAYAGNLLAFYSATPPPGYFLEATDNSLEFGQGAADTTSSAGPAGWTSSWQPPQSFTSEQKQDAARQLSGIEAKGAFSVVYGQPYQLFAITNNAGEIYKGFFELIGPPARTSP